MRRILDWRWEEEIIAKTRDTLARPVETWSVDDLKTAMYSETYRNAWDAEYEDVHRLVDRWHELFDHYGRPRRSTQEQEKADPARPPLAPQARDRIRVRAHMRVGLIPVRAHDRARRRCLRRKGFQGQAPGKKTP